jgi:hypothetical protein
MISNDDAVRTFPQLARLVEIKEAGWIFRPFPDENGMLVGLVDWHTEGDTTDALWVFGRDQCRAARVTLGYGGGVVWEYGGDLETSVDELLALPQPGERSAPRLVRRHAPGLWTL